MPRVLTSDVRMLQITDNIMAAHRHAMMPLHINLCLLEWCSPAHLGQGSRMPLLKHAPPPHGYHTEFGRSRSNFLGICIGVPKIFWGCWGSAPVEKSVADPKTRFSSPTRVTESNLVAYRSNCRPTRGPRFRFIVYFKCACALHCWWIY